MGDPNMNIALDLARGLSPDLHVSPDCLADPLTLAELVDEIDGPIVVDGNGDLRFDLLGERLRAISEKSTLALHAFTDPVDRLAVALRIWAGCLMAAKLIAHETRGGPNTNEMRASMFPQVDSLARNDPAFCAGVEAAPAFKATRGQEIALGGVPADSPVRRHVGA